MGLSGDNGLRITHNGVFPLRGGYRARRPTHSRQLSVFPLRAGVIGAHNVVRGYVKSVSPVWGLSGNNGLRITHNGVCPLRAGVIGVTLKSGLRLIRVSPACGGYRFLFGFAIISTLCFPCVGVIGLSAIRRFIAVSVSPAYRGYLGHVAFYGKNGIELPLCGVIGAPVPDRLSQERISPAWGLSGMDVLRNYSVTVFPLHGGYWRIRGAILPGPCVFPLRAGVNGLLRAYHRYCLILPEFGGCRAIEREPIFTVLVFSLLRGVNDVVGEGICHQ